MKDPAEVRLNAFTVDVEDYFHVSSFEKHVHRDDWGRYESRVQRSTHRVLDLLGRSNVRGTFFVLGWVGERFPQLVRDILAAGHELACHSYWHRLVYRLTREEFRADLVRSRDVLQDISGKPVTIYRAPSFSVTEDSLWALDILAEEGFRVDSSIYPIHHDRYGIPDAKPMIHPIDTSAGKLWEFPATVLRVGRLNLPVSGGGYFRFYPVPLSIRFLSRVNRLGRAFAFYIHPWELDPEQPRMAAKSRVSRFRHYVNLGSTERKLERLLKAFSFGTMSEVVEQAQREFETASPQGKSNGKPLNGGAEPRMGDRPAANAGGSFA